MNPLAMLQKMSLGPAGGYQELLTEEQLKAARQHGMLGAGAAMMAGGGWSQQPRTMGQQLGQGLLGGMQMQGQAMNQMATLGLAQQTRQQQERALTMQEAAANQPKREEVKIGDRIVTVLRYPDGSMEPLADAPRWNQQQGQGGVREQKIQDAMSTLGLSRAEAVKLADGYTRLTTDELGNRVLTDMTQGGRSRLLEVEGGVRPPDPSPHTPFAPNNLAFDPAEGTGAAASAKGLWNRTLGQVPLLPVFQTAETAAQHLRFVERDVIKALGSSGRPPVVEQQRIMAMIPTSMDWTQNPRAAQQNMASLADLLGMQYAADLSDSRDPMLPQKVRTDAVARSREVARVLRNILEPDSVNKLLGHYEGGGNQNDTDSLVDKWRTR